MPLFIYAQQLKILTNRTGSCANRVISILQFRIRSIVRAKTKVEFDADKRTNRAEMRAELPNTAQCWTGMCSFVKNVMNEVPMENWSCLFEQIDV